MALSSLQRRNLVDGFVARFALIGNVSQSYVDNAVMAEAVTRAQQIGFIKDNSDPVAIDSLVEVIAKVNNDKTDVLTLLSAKADVTALQVAQVSVADLTAQVNTIEADLDYVAQNLPQ